MWRESDALSLGSASTTPCPWKKSNSGCPLRAFVVSIFVETRCLLGAASNLDNAGGRLSLGIHAGTPYYDCSSSFLTDVQRLLDGYFGGTVRVEAPFVEFTKRDVFDFCLRNRVPVDLTFSCERSSDCPCGECRSCEERLILREGYEGF